MPIEFFFDIFDLFGELLSVLQRAVFCLFFHQCSGYVSASSFHKLSFPVKMLLYILKEGWWSTQLLLSIVFLQ